MKIYKTLLDSLNIKPAKWDKKSIHLVYMIFLFCILYSGYSQEYVTDPIIHDPVMIKHADTYYLFCTGMGINVLSSKDMKTWKRERPVFETAPEWTFQKITDFKGHFWAPDISFHDSIYFLYYSVSSFGKNTSCIGLATNKTLDRSSPEFNWEDQGMIIQSVPGRDMWNAIDPNIITDEEGINWMTFGSFWNGIKLVKLSNDLRGIEKEPECWYTIASRPRSFKIEDKNPGDAAIEAPFIFRKDGFYYLFVSFDYCCKGINSNYKIMIGRSEKVTGPYLDKSGQRMDQGGGLLLLAGNQNWPGLGHNAVYTFDNKDYLIFHAYDAMDNGKPKLLIRTLSWDTEGWPSVNLD